MLKRTLCGAGLLVLLAGLSGCGDGGGGPGDGLPDELPIVFTRPDVGTPLTGAEVTDFTRKLTGFWKDRGYWDWVLRVS
ncbi:MAG TPA: hypothetical protein P5076_18375, partial [Myxococcota bacterium]|nr:hypothetical protein [Myxococcota bacterium]